MRNIVTISIISVFLLLLCWNVFLPFYHEPYTTPLPPPDESRCFSPKCHSILKENGNNRLILMIHGFPACPYVFSYFADYFSSIGYDVYVPLLPGFGTNPKDLEKTSFNQWYGYIRQYYLDLRKKYPKVIIMGHSMGGAMALKLAEEFQNTEEQPDALVTISAIVWYPKTPLLAARTLAAIKPSYFTYTEVQQDREDGQNEWTGYEGLFARASLSLLANLPSIRKAISAITIPFFAVQDKGDKTVPFKNLEIIQDKEASFHFQSLAMDMGPYKHTRHNLPMYHSIQKGLATTISSFLFSCDACH